MSAGRIRIWAEMPTRRALGAWLNRNGDPGIGIREGMRKGRVRAKKLKSRKAERWAFQSFKQDAHRRFSYLCSNCNSPFSLLRPSRLSAPILPTTAQSPYSLVLLFSNPLFRPLGPRPPSPSVLTLSPLKTTC